MSIIINTMLIIFSALILIKSLRCISDKKNTFQKYPDTIKKDYYAQIRIIAILNYISVAVLIAAALYMNSNLFLILLALSTFISVTSLSYIYEDFGTEDEK